MPRLRNRKSCKHRDTHHKNYAANHACNDQVSGLELRRVTLVSTTLADADEGSEHCTHRREKAGALAVVLATFVVGHTTPLLQPYFCVPATSKKV